LNGKCPTEEFTPAPFNAYGRSKLAAEGVFRQWSSENPDTSVTVVRPCVVFGEGNRGNVYNLLKQVYSQTFLMIGNGSNRKSLAYVGNIVPFLISAINKGPGFRLYNYADKPDLTTNELIAIARNGMRRNGLLSKIRLPYSAGMFGGYCCDMLAALTQKKLPISSIRVKKFCAETTVGTSKLELEKFERPFTLEEGLRRTIASEFMIGTGGKHSAQGIAKEDRETVCR
jgi:nucleoside-diphosphate-sugar epimerase